MKNQVNLDLLNRFWNRSPFHDEIIEEVTSLRGRVLIRLARMTLIITGVTVLRRCELPTAWLYESVVREDSKFTLNVETEGGDLVITGRDVRLVRNDDLAVLIPPVDV